MTSVVYFIQCKPLGPIKIGVTGGNVWSRIRALQTTSPHELEWLGYFIGTHDDEQAAHRLLKEHLIRAEWFHPHDDVLAFVKSKCPAFSQEQYRREVFHEEERLAVRALPTWARCQLAAKHKIEYAHLLDWLGCHGAPDIRLARQLAKDAKSFPLQ